MAERRTQVGAVTGRMPGGKNIEDAPRGRDLQDGLRIDRDDLDSCLIEQPDRYWRVAEAHVRARAALDAAKLAIEELTARLDHAIRRDAEQAEKKITEAAIQREIQLNPDYHSQRQGVLRLTAEVDELQALKEAYQQRSFMLRELVSLTIAERGDQAGARGSYEARARRADEAQTARGAALRRERGGARG